MFTEPYANTNGQGGFLEESPGYGASLADYPIIPFVTENFLGRDMYSETQYFKSLAYFVLYNTLPAPTYNKVAQQPFYQLFTYADDSQYVDAGSELKARNYFQNFMLNTAEYYPSIPVGQYARQWYNTIVTPGSGYDCHDINADSHQPCGYVAAQDTGGVSLPYSSLPLDYYSSGYMISRTAWDTSSAVARWQMNYPIDNEHSHYDAGSFDIWRRGSDPMGRWLTRESAGYSNIFNGYNNGNSPAAAKEVSDQQLLAHNTLLIDGKNAPTDDDNKRAISVNRLQSSSGFAYADVDLSNLYKSSSGSNVAAVVHVEREFLYLRGLETLLVFDRLEVQSPDGGITPSSQVIKSFLLHAETNPVINDNQHVTVTNGNEVLHVTTLLPSSSNGYRVVDESNCADCSKDGSAQFRVELDDSGGVNSLCNGTDTCSYFLHVLQARDQSATDIAASVVDDGTFFTVTLQPNGQNATTIVLNKGMTSSGGSVNIANSGAISLQPGLQSITYGDGGPVWH